MPKLRNPGLYSFLIFLSMALLVGFLQLTHAPEAGKLAGELLALALACFGAKSALSAKPPRPPPPSRYDDKTSLRGLPPMREKLPTWPDFDAKKKDGGQ